MYDQHIPHTVELITLKWNEDIIVKCDNIYIELPYNLGNWKKKLLCIKRDFEPSIIYPETTP
jgi:hypothetical protein